MALTVQPQSPSTVRSLLTLGSDRQEPTEKMISLTVRLLTGTACEDTTDQEVDSGGMEALGL
jgi:hypothetical protein